MNAQEEKLPMQVKLIGGGILAFILLIVVIMAWPFTTVQAGERGVVFNNISGIEDRILGEGTHVRIPFVESVIKMPIQTQSTAFDEKGADSAGTQDSQRVDLKVTINWHLDPSAVNKVYQETGDQDAIISKVLNNNTQDAIKQSVSKYQALQLQQNRDKVATAALVLLQQKVKPYHIIVENLSLTNLDFTGEFNAAIEQAQVAQQQAKKAEYQVTQVKNEAQAAIAKAEGEAAAQKLRQSTLTPDLLKQQWIEAWRAGGSQVPRVITGGSSSNFIDLNAIAQ